MKVYTILKDPSPSLIEALENQLNELGYIVRHNNIKELMEAEIVLCEACEDINSVAELGIAYGDFLFRQLKTIIVVGKLPSLINEEHVKKYSTICQAVAEYFVPNSTLKKSAPDSQVAEITSMLKYLSLALYPYLVPEIGESISIELTEEDINKMSDKIVVRLEKREKSVLIGYKERINA